MVYAGGTGCLGSLYVAREAVVSGIYCGRAVTHVCIPSSLLFAAFQIPHRRLRCKARFRVDGCSEGIRGFAPGPEKHGEIGRS